MLFKPIPNYLLIFGNKHFILLFTQITGPLLPFSNTNRLMSIYITVNLITIFSNLLVAYVFLILDLIKVINWNFGLFLASFCVTVVNIKDMYAFMSLHRVLILLDM